jgi:hypothetical protein
MIILKLTNQEKYMNAIVIKLIIFIMAKSLEINLILIIIIRDNIILLGRVIEKNKHFFMNNL